MSYDKGGGGGPSGAATTDQFAFDQPYEIGDTWSAETAAQINEMLRLLFKSQTRMESDPNAAFAKGPTSAIDGNLAVFDGTTGKLLKDGGTGAAATVIAVAKSLTETDLESMNATPFTMVAAQGSGKSIWPIRHYIELVVTTGYGSSPTFTLVHGGQTTALMEVLNPSWGTTGTKRQTHAAVGSVVPSYNPANKSLDIRLSTDAPTGGVATAKYGVAYYVLDLS